MKGGHFKIPACCSRPRLILVCATYSPTPHPGGSATISPESVQQTTVVRALKAPRKAAHKMNSPNSFISKSSTRAFDKFPFNPHTLNYRQDASRGRRYQEVHRDLPSEGRLLRADQEEPEDQQHQVQGPLPEAPLHLGSQGHRQGREAQAEPSPQPATHRCFQEGQEV